MATQQPPNAAEIGRRLLNRREELHLDQDEVATRAGVSRPYVSRLERGAVPNPKVYDLAQVAAVLDLPLAALVSESIHTREIALADGANILEELAGYPPDLAADILKMWRASLQIASNGRAVREN